MRLNKMVRVVLFWPSWYRKTLQTICIEQCQQVCFHFLRHCENCIKSYADLQMMKVLGPSSTVLIQWRN